MEQMCIKEYKKKFGKLGNCSSVTYSIIVNQGIKSLRRLLPLELEIMLGKFGEVKLANGIVWHDTTKWHCHAWIEDDLFCYDFANGNDMIIRKKRYYDIGKIKDVIFYTRKEALEKGVTTGIAGFWDILIE